MVAPNWSLLGGNNALASFGTGLQLGQQMRDRQEAREHQNALLQIKQGEADLNRKKFEREVRTDDVRARAAKGDPAAMAELAGLDFNAWRGLTADNRAAVNDRAKVLGNAALDVLSRPPEQRAAVWDAYIGQLSQQFPGLEQYAGQYSEQAARGVVAQAEMIGKLHDMEAPRYQAIPEGGALVNTRDPTAVQQYMDGTGASVGGGYDEWEVVRPGGAGGNASGGF